jgi:large subunit ribosomal protein L1
MPYQGKRYRADVTKVKEGQVYPITEAVAVLKTFTPAKYDQTVDVCIHLGIDPKQTDQTVRGSVSLPHGTGAKKRVIAFCGADKAEAARQAGAVEVGGEELVKKVEEGFMDFDVAVADPSMMRFVGRLGKVLGPRGLMPSPKAGTVTPDVGTAVREYTAGKVNFKNDAGGNVQAPIGKLSFGPAELEANLRAFLDTVQRMKPSAAKGQYIKKISISGTMTPGVLCATATAAV